MKIRLVLGGLVLWMAALVAGMSPAGAAGPEPTVGVEVLSPAVNSGILPGDSLEVTARITDPQDLVRRVFVRLGTATGSAINADQDARKDGGVYRLVVRIPLSVRPGKYLVQVQAMGDERPLQWATVPVEVKSVQFSLRVLSPAPQAALSRNESFDVVAQVDDPRKKTRRVFVEFEDVSRRLILNANRDADRKGNIWSMRIHVPPTVSPGIYSVNVRVHGEGLELLASARVPVTVAMAPVGIREFRLDREKDVRPGETVRVTAQIDDTRKVIRQVVVVCLGPDGKRLAGMPAEQRQGTWVRDLTVDMDAISGVYVVELQAVGQQGEIVASRRLSFTVSASLP